MLTIPVVLGATVLRAGLGAASAFSLSKRATLTTARAELGRIVSGGRCP